MFTVILIIALVICVILALAVLIQNPKGGGLSGTFGGTANQLFGYKRTSDDIEKITWYLGIALLVLCLGSAAFKPGTTGAQATPFEGRPFSRSKTSRLHRVETVPRWMIPIQVIRPVQTMNYLNKK